MTKWLKNAPLRVKNSDFRGGFDKYWQSVKGFNEIFRRKKVLFLVAGATKKTGVPLRIFFYLRKRVSTAPKPRAKGGGAKGLSG